MVKNITFVERHGVSEGRTCGFSTKININNEYVRIHDEGILPSLSKYLGEKETKKNHSLKELFFNLPYIHRTYCLTYPSQTNMFIPLCDCLYVRNKNTKELYFRATLSADFSLKSIIRRLPPTFVSDSLSSEGILSIRSKNSFIALKAGKLSDEGICKLQEIHKELREELYYINGAETLWYVRCATAGPSRLLRFPLTITLAAMHRLSELCRYHPLEFSSFLSGRQSWLLSEFIEQSSVQFIDEIASEITGYQFLTPNVRPAS